MKLALSVLLLAVAGAAGWTALTPGGDPALSPETVSVPPGAWDWRPAGEWRRAGREIDAPLRRLSSDEPLHVMRHLVSRADYAACVAEGACADLGNGVAPDAAMPQTGLSWRDATAYAIWLSDRTGQTWRLPTDEEWQRLAAERFVDDAVGDTGLDPSARWVAAYAREAELRGEADGVLRPAGGWGENSLGVADLAGNIWEWTDACATTVTVDAHGAVVSEDPFCGARIAQGKHRAVVIDFVRDARSGGCAAGVPPDFLGVRLVREDG